MILEPRRQAVAQTTGVVLLLAAFIIGGACCPVAGASTTGSPAPGYSYDVLGCSRSNATLSSLLAAVRPQSQMSRGDTEVGGGERPGTTPTATGEGVATNSGTIWDDVAATGSRYSGTEMPRSLALGLDDGTQVWLHPNATKHLAERAAGAGTSGPISVQSQLRSLQAAISEVNRGGVSLGKIYNVGGWELQFGIRTTDDLAVVNHARYVG